MARWPNTLVEFEWRIGAEGVRSIRQESEPFCLVCGADTIIGCLHNVKSR